MSTAGENLDVDALVAEIGQIAGAAVEAAGSATTQADLDAVRTSVYGRKSRLSELRRAMGTAPPEAKPVLGRAISAANSRVDAALAARAADLAGAAEAAQLERERIDVTLPGRRAPLGRRHPVTKVIQDFEDLFVGMGYRVVEGPEAETDWHNFEALNIPKGHPARSMWDTLYLSGTAGVGTTETDVLLRTHTSPVQIRVMQAEPPPLYIIAPGRTFRRDTLDRTHSPIFHQVEGLAVDRDLTFGDLAGTLEWFCHELFGPGFDIRLHPDYFPFTEPSAGIEVWWGDRWLEIAGCGMVDPNVFVAVGIDPEEWQGFAFGFGVERIAMLRYGIDDIRLFYENDQRFLEQFT
jgi:phenylalanyl-tRNA synthetase alpha chain